jgi:hypothetical protein
MHNHLVEPGVEGRKVTSHKMANFPPKKSLLTTTQMIGFFSNPIILQNYYYYVKASIPKLNDIL